jgi:hypothetical protein
MILIQGLKEKRHPLTHIIPDRDRIDLVLAKLADQAHMGNKC